MRNQWQPMSNAPKDGTVIDLWVTYGNHSFLCVNYWWSPTTRTWISMQEKLIHGLNINLCNIRGWRMGTMHSQRSVVKGVRKAVCKAILNETGDGVELEKIEGVYYWCIPANHPSHEAHSIDHFTETCTHFTTLPSVQELVDNYKAKREDAGLSA